MTVFRCAFIRYFPNSSAFLAKSIGPLVLILFVYKIWENTPFLILSSLGLILINGLFAPALILRDRSDGSHIRIAISPTPTISYLAQNLFASIIPCVIQIILLASVGFYKYSWSIKFAIALTFSVILFAIANSTFMILLNMVFKTEKSKGAFFAILALLALTVPPQKILFVIQNIGPMSHPYWLIRSVASLEADGITMTFWLYQLVLTLFATGYLVVGGTRKMN